ncbi:hypothetical protein ACJMK2_039485 [Sinanodonta woodiana]|uniref:C-type lectin domain-containing protein n=1 Tax=Sinanodonta woodiana TaxID=1069815 RepID=A0ABD3WC51_SINWO
MKILTFLGFMVLLTSSPPTNCFPGLPVPIPVYISQPVAGSNVGLLECRLGYTINDNECGRFCYRLESRNCISFMNAQALCKQEGGDLLEPDVCTFPLFHGLARRQRGSCGDYWVGAFRTPPALNYMTVRGAALPDNFQFWGVNQPSRTVTAGRQQACVQIENGNGFLLNDDVCANRGGFICQQFI